MITYEKIPLYMLVVGLVLPLNKKLLRPWVLDGDVASIFVIFVNSLPNFLEAIIGTLLLTLVGIQLRSRFGARFGEMTDASLYLVVTILAGAYVISQEVKLHDLGGNNVYDPYDLVASIVGLILINRVITKCGITEPRMR